MARADDIATALLLQAITLARVTAGEQRRIAGRLRQLWRQLRTMVATEDPTAPRTLAGQLRQATALMRQVATAVAEAFGTIAATHAVTREEVAAWTLETTPEVLSALGEADLLARVPSERQQRQTADALILGATVEDWWGRQAATAERSIGDRMRQRLLQESALPDIVREVDTVEVITQNAAESLVETSMVGTHQEAMARIADANARRVGALQWVTTLDTRACFKCLALSGQSWTLDHMPLNSKGWPGMPPLHFNCRCQMVPVPKGEPLATDLAFEPWLKQRPEGDQRAILGPRRFELWQAGKLRLSRLVDQRHRPLTLEELRPRTAA